MGINRDYSNIFCPTLLQYSRKWMAMLNKIASFKILVYLFSKMDLMQCFWGWIKFLPSTSKFVATSLDNFLKARCKMAYIQQIDFPNHCLFVHIINKQIFLPFQPISFFSFDIISLSIISDLLILCD